MSSYRLLAYVLSFNWEGIINQYDEILKLGSPGRAQAFALFASRGYAERGDFDQAAECIIKANLPEARLPVSTLAFGLVPFFSLLGARNQAEKLITAAKNTRSRAAGIFRIVLAWSLSGG